MTTKEKGPGGTGPEGQTDDRDTVCPTAPAVKPEPPMFKPDRRRSDPDVDRFHSALAVFFRALRAELRGGAR